MIRKDRTLAFLGCGHIASALVEGIINCGYKRDKIIITRRNKEILQEQARRLGVRPAASNEEAVSQAEIILLCVRPGQVKSLLDEIGSGFNRQQSLVISLIAGLRMDTLQSCIAKPIVRFMPNLAGRIGFGVTAMLASADVQQEDMNLAQDMASALGFVVTAKNDEEMNTYTALCGSGIAYMFYFLASLSQSGAQLGLSKEMSSDAVFQTLRGAIRLIEKEGGDPMEYLNEIQVPQGTTEAAMEVLAGGDFQQAIAGACTAAKERAAALGEDLALSLKSLT